MKQLVNNQKAFLELLKAGLWEEEVRLSSLGEIDFREICRIATEQSVVGLVAAGIEHMTDVKAPQDISLTIAGETLQLEQRNKAMNVFIAELIEKLRKSGIYALLVKGQGIAQCYERPLWRACGDVDLFLEGNHYFMAMANMEPMATVLEDEDVERQHLELAIGGWIVELHGTLRTSLGKKINHVIDEVQRDTFENSNVRVWRNGDVDVCLPNVDNDIVFVFTHILQHFFMGGIGLRQICDWCRLLWIYRDEIDRDLLEKRLKDMVLLSEWKAYAALSVDYMGLPKEIVPLYDSSKCWSNKALQILMFIFETGNFGQNRDTLYYQKYPFLIYKTISLWRNTWDTIRHLRIFPKDAARIWFIRLGESIKVAMSGK